MIFMRKQIKKRKESEQRKTRKILGFSIIELTIILTIFSLFAVNLMVTDDAEKSFKKQHATYAKLKVIQKALSNYVKEYGHYPCPADGEIGLNNDSLGKMSDEPLNPSAQNRSLLLGFTYCNTSNFVSPTVDPTLIGPLSPRDYARLEIGIVPIRDLGLPTEYMVDEFGNRITYVVRKELTHTSTWGMATNADGRGSPHSGSQDGRTLEIKNDTNMAFSDNAAYLLISHGPNGYGAYPYHGGITGNLTTRIFPPDIGAGPSCDIINGPPGSVAGTFSVGELENHHLCEEARGLPEPINDTFFIPYTPEISHSNDVVAYDDIVLWGNQESHDFDSPLDSQNMPALTDYHEGVGSSPDQIVGLALWYDAQDCRTITTNNIGTASPADVCGMTPSDPPVDVINWMEKVSVYNNYYSDNIIPLVISEMKGNAASSRAGRFPSYDPNPTSADRINGFPALTFDGSVDMLVLDGPLVARPAATGAVTDPSFTPASLTIFVVGQISDLVGNTSNDFLGSRAQTFIARTNKFYDGFPKRYVSNGYALFTYSNTGPDYYKPAERIGFGVNDFYQVCPGPHDHTGMPPDPQCLEIGDTPHKQQNVVSMPADTNPHVIAASFKSGVGGSFLISDGCLIHEAKPVPGNLIHKNELSQAVCDGAAAWECPAVTIGELATAAGFGNLNGKIGEIIMYERALTDWEREEVVRYLADKWDFPASVTSSCSASQPNVTAACVGKSLLGGPDGPPADPSVNCCSGYSNSNKCCMATWQSHVEKCKSDDDCCPLPGDGRVACSAYGHCYRAADINPHHTSWD